MNNLTCLNTPHFDRLLQTLTKWRLSRSLSPDASLADLVYVYYHDRLEAVERHLLLLEAFPLLRILKSRDIEHFIYRRIDELFILLLEPPIAALLMAQPRLRSSYIHSRNPPSSSQWPQTYRVSVDDGFDQCIIFKTWGHISECPDNLLPLSNYWRANQLIQGGELVCDRIGSAAGIKARMRKRYLSSPLEERLLYQAALLFIR